MQTKPYSFNIALPGGRPSTFHVHVTRTLSEMRGQYLDEQAIRSLLAEKGDVLLYEVFELSRPMIAGELIHGVSIVHPGKVGDEYFMTKGHFHTVLDTSELYYCLKGQGFMVMENQAGDCEVLELCTGCGVYVLPGWAHRSVNTSPNQDLITVFAYPGNAGHDYGTIEIQGFRKLIIERTGSPVIIENPRWMAPEERV